MLSSILERLKARMHGRRSFVYRLRKDERGTTAIEFGMVSVPFLVMAFGIMGVGLQFFTINSLEQGVSNASRKIRTGTAQTGTIVASQVDDKGTADPSDDTTTPTTVGNFKTLICNESAQYITCDSHLAVHVQSGAEWSDIDPVECVTNGELTPQIGPDADLLTDYTGGASQVVLVTACYEWSLGGPWWQNIWNLLTVGAWSNGVAAREAGKVIIQAVTTFRTEPYE